jgi:hypothetical protein
MKELEGYHEAIVGPSGHTCRGTLVDAIISRRRLVLICYDCLTYWHTGKIDGVGHVSMADLVKSSDQLYQIPQYKRYRLMHELRDAETERMYKAYRRGESLSEIAARYEVTRQSVFERFKRRGYKLRPTHPHLHDKIEWNGNEYTPAAAKGYYRRTREPRTMLHYDIWEFHNGPVPDGHQIGHKDGNKENNDITNLVCLPAADLTRFYHPQMETETRYCLGCGAKLVRKTRPNGSVEGPAALLRRQYCNRQCAKHRFAEQQYEEAA